MAIFNYFRAGTLLLLSLPLTAWADAGHFETARGQVSITRNAETLKARPGTAVLSRDAIATGSFSSAKLKMADDSTLVIAKNSNFKIDEFAIGQSTPKYTFTRGIVRYIGGTQKPLVSTIYGKIADEGTDYSAAICGAGCKEKHGMYVGVEAGTVALSNAYGKLVVPAGTFAFMESGKAPVKLDAAPAILVNAVAELDVNPSGDVGIGSSGTVIVNAHTPTLPPPSPPPGSPDHGLIDVIVDPLPVVGPIVGPIVEPIESIVEPLLPPELAGSPS